MADLASPSIRVQILIEKPDFRDAIYMSHAEYVAASDAAIQAMQDQRYNDWQAALQAAKAFVPLPPTKDELIAKAEALAEQKTEIDAELADVTVKLQAVGVAVGVAEPVELIGG